MYYSANYSGLLYTRKQQAWKLDLSVRFQASVSLKSFRVWSDSWCSFDKEYKTICATSLTIRPFRIHVKEIGPSATDANSWTQVKWSTTRYNINSQIANQRESVKILATKQFQLVGVLHWSLAKAFCKIDDDYTRCQAIAQFLASEFRRLSASTAECARV